MPDFVRAAGTQFRLGEESFICSGFNCYFLSFCGQAAREGVFEVARQIGANTIRGWGFLDVADRLPGAPAFQYASGGTIALDEGVEGLERLDHLIAAAERANLRLILPLVNGWPDFGGIPFYLAQLGLSNDPLEFFRSQPAKDAYQRWAEHLLTRRNTQTGRQYLAEPAILAWELANEPRCPGRTGASALLQWADEMSAWLKQLDGNHLVAVGDEGFFRRLSLSHLYDGRYGVDAEALLQLESVDFGTFHLYPENWGMVDKDNEPEKWIHEHAEAGRRAGKPMLLEEFGLRESTLAGKVSRKETYDRWIQLVQAEGLAGALVWMVGSQQPETVGFRDEYTLFEAADLGFAGSPPVS